MPAGRARRPIPRAALVGVLACAALGLAACSASRPAPGLALQQSAGRDSSLLASAGEFVCPTFDPTDAGKHLRNAVEPLMDGDEATARRELRLALCQDPDDAAAKDLLSQLDAVPEELLGRDFFVHEVRADDSLPRLAKEFLGDPYRFYALARYNGMRRPGRLRAGQCLKIPGRSAPEGGDPGERLYQCGLGEWTAGELKNAREFLAEALAHNPDHLQARAKLDEIAPAVVAAYRRDAAAALRQGNLGQALWSGQKLLEIAPGDAQARSLVREVGEVRSRLVGVLYGEALAAFERQDWAESMADCDEALRLDPGHGGAKELRARAASR